MRYLVLLNLRMMAQAMPVRMAGKAPIKAEMKAMPRIMPKESRAYISGEVGMTLQMVETMKKRTPETIQQIEKPPEKADSL